MKSEERHKLQRNVLAQWIGDTYRQIAPYARPLLAGGAALLVTMAVVTWWRSHSATSSAQACDSLFASLGDTEKLDDLASADPKGSVGMWATLAAADRRLERGTRALFANRTTASKDLQEAIEGYSKLVAGKPAPIVRLQALFGRARAHEALMGTRQAGEHYDQVIADYQEIQEQDGLFSAHAKQRLEALKSQEVIDFYRKFAEYNPPARSPDAGAFRNLPFDLNAPPDQQEFSKSILNLDDLKKQLDAKEPTEKGASGKPAADKTEAVPALKAPASVPAPAAAKTEVPKR